MQLVIGNKSCCSIYIRILSKFCCCNPERRIYQAQFHLPQDQGYIHISGFTKFCSNSRRIRVISAVQDSPSSPFLAGSGLYPQCRILQAHQLSQDQGYICSAGFSKFCSSKLLHMQDKLCSGASFYLYSYLVLLVHTLNIQF